MKTPRILYTASCLILALSLAQAQEKKRISPQETIKATIDDAQITIVYSRPYTKDPKTGETRKIWGGLVPYGKIWRTGANEATLFTTDKPIEIGGTALPAGTYSLFTLPEENGAKLVINKQTGQWGTKYDEKQDFARVDLTRSTFDKPVEQFTMAVEKNPSGGGTLKLTWETTAYSVNFSVKK